MMICTKLVSFPTRERGLKRRLSPQSSHPSKSFPTRERGLKPPAPTRFPDLSEVVPYAGTWIETE